MNGNIFKIAVNKGYEKSNITNESLIDWIFSDKFVYDYTPINNIPKEFKNDVINHLKFWYTTLLEYKFSLMYEFIGRLEEWFESNNYFIGIRYKGDEDTNKWECSIGHIDWYYPMFSEIYNTKQQAKHEAILKCFQLLMKRE